MKNKSVVVLGSSELTAQTRKYIPNKFLTDSLGIPCIAFGKGGNQCFNIFCQLLSFNKDIRNSRVVIILSPGWFDEYSDGTAAEMFLLYNNKRTLGYILQDDSIPDRFKNYIGKYVTKHLPTIDAPDETLMQFYYLYKTPIQSAATFPFAAFHQLLWEKRNTIFETAYQNNYFPYPVNFSETEKLLPKSNPISAELKFRNVNWDSLSKLALDTFYKNSNNNSSGVGNEYYNTWVRGKGPKQNKNLELKKNQEYSDFLMLKDLLAYYKVNAYFVIQGLNPYVFEAPQRLDHTIDAIKKRNQ